MNLIDNNRLKAYFKALLFIICSIIVHFKVFCRMKYLCPNKLYLKYALPGYSGDTDPPIPVILTPQPDRGLKNVKD